MQIKMNMNGLDAMKILVATQAGPIISFFWKFGTGTEMPAEISNYISSIIACAIGMFVINPSSPLLNGAVEARAQQIVDNIPVEKR